MTQDGMMRSVIMVGIVAVIISAFALGSWLLVVPESSLPELADSEPVFEGIHVTVHTDKQEYNLGETVKYTIANVGTEIAWFTDTAYSFQIEDLSGNVIASFSAGSAMTDLQPGKRDHNNWDQTDSSGRSVPTGTYVAVAGSFKSEPFTIIHDESAYPGLVFEEGRHLTVITDKLEYQVGERVKYTIINTGTENVRYDTVPFPEYVKNHLGEVVYERANTLPRQSESYAIQPNHRYDFVWAQDIRADPDGRNLCSFYNCLDAAPRGGYLENIDKLGGQQVPAGTYVIVVYGWWESPPFVIRE